jgi:hypothetical protein
MKKTIIGLACLVIAGISLALAQEAASTETILLGTWSVKIGNYEDIWTFKENGVAVSAKEPKNNATWKKEDNCILIQWAGVENGYKTWEAFTLPLKKDGTQGGNWRGMKVTAKKIE